MFDFILYCLKHFLLFLVTRFKIIPKGTYRCVESNTVLPTKPAYYLVTIAYIEIRNPNVPSFSNVKIYFNGSKFEIDEIHYEIVAWLPIFRPYVVKNKQVVFNKLIAKGAKPIKKFDFIKPNTKK